MGSKKKRSRPKAKPMPQATPNQSNSGRTNWKRGLKWLAAALIAFFAWAIPNWEHLVKFPTALEQSFVDLSVWWHDDQGWNGFWAGLPEGMLLDEQVVPSDVELDIHVHRGVVGGTITSKAACDSFPLFDYLQVTGTASASKATIEVWDLVLGHRKVFATLSARRNGNGLILEPRRGGQDWFPAGTTLWKDDPPPEVRSLGNQRTETQIYCEKKRVEFLNEVRTRNFPNAPAAGGKRAPLDAHIEEPVDGSPTDSKPATDRPH